MSIIWGEGESGGSGIDLKIIFELDRGGPWQAKIEWYDIWTLPYLYTLAVVHTELGERLGHDSIRILFTKWEIIIMKCVAFM